jgi:uncharacterized protein YebE (UPF0316 family)
MFDFILLNSGIYTWLIIPALIFIARIMDVSLGTVRVIFISKGLKYLAPLVGFFEILIWLMAIGQIMTNLSNPACYIAYAGGFAMGNFVGICIAEKLSIGVVILRVVTKKDAGELIKSLSESEYGATSLEGKGAEGKVNVIFTVVPRREVPYVVELIKKFNPGAFYSIEEVGFVEKGIFPPRKGRWDYESLFRFLWPFRKGK